MVAFNSRSILIMKSFLRSPVDVCDAPVLGVMMTMLILAMAGAVKVWIKGGTEDGFLFDLLFYGWPLWVTAPFLIAYACGRLPRFRLVCRFITYGYFAVALIVVSLRWLCG